jgi:hypothetical protein
MKKLALVLLTLSSLTLSSCGSGQSASTTTEPIASNTPPAPSYGWVQAQAVQMYCKVAPYPYPDLAYGWNRSGDAPYFPQTAWETDVVDSRGVWAWGCGAYNSYRMGVSASCSYDSAKVTIGYNFECTTTPEVSGQSYPQTFRVVFDTPVNGQWSLSQAIGAQ